MKQYAAVLAAALCAVAHAQTQIFNDKASFLAAASPVIYCEDFASVAGGPVAPGGLNFGPVSGYAYNLDAPGQLVNAPGIISTNIHFDPIVVTFSGNPVSAVGGNFWATDVNVQPIAGKMEIKLSDGTVETFEAVGSDAFRGFVSTEPLSVVQVRVIDAGGSAAWSTLDNLCVGKKLPQCEWDLNGDGKVCQEDLGLLLMEYGTKYNQSHLGGLLQDYNGGCGDPCN